MRIPLAAVSVVTLAAALLVVACAPFPARDVTACPLDAKVCPDGSSVGRVGPDCAFAPCPMPGTPGTNTSTPELERFPVNHTGAIGIMCMQLYDPVCGWFNESVQCLAYPCAQTYPNSCYAAKDDKVAYYTRGACPGTGNASAT